MARLLMHLLFLGTNAVCERRCRCACFAFSATGRRNSIGFRPRRTPTDVVSRIARTSAEASARGSRSRWSHRPCDGHHTGRIVTRHAGSNQRLGTICE